MTTTTPDAPRVSGGCCFHPGDDGDETVAELHLALTAEDSRDLAGLDRG